MSAVSDKTTFVSPRGNVDDINALSAFLAGKSSEGRLVSCSMFLAPSQNGETAGSYAKELLDVTKEFYAGDAEEITDSVLSGTF